MIPVSNKDLEISLLVRLEIKFFWMKNSNIQGVKTWMGRGCASDF